MSAIDPTVPLDTDLRSDGANQIRIHRTWLYNFATAFLVNHQGSGYDPSTWTGELKLSNSPPGSPQVGNLYFTTTGLLYSYKAGPTAQLSGDIEMSSEAVFCQSAAPTGWTRNTSGGNGAALRYLASGTPSAGGTQDSNTALSHAGLFFVVGPTLSLFGGVQKFKQVPATHPVLKYIDVLTAVKQ